MSLPEEAALPPREDHAAPSSSALTARRRNRWLFFALFVLMFAVQYRTLFLGTPINADPTQRVWLHLDEATVNYDAARIADGQVMYRDFFTFQGPVHYHLYAGLFAVVGRSFQAARVLTVFTVALSACLLALLVFRLFRGGTAGYIAGLSAALIHGAGMLPTWSCAYPHWTADFLTLLGLVLLTGPTRSFRQMLLAGAVLSAASWTIISVGFPATVAALFAVLFFSRPLSDHQPLALKVRAAPVLGFLLFMVPWLIYFVAVGALDDLIYANFLWPFESYGAGQSDVNRYATYIDRTVNNHAALGAPWSWFGWILAETTRTPPLVAFVAVLPAAALGLVRRFAGERGQWVDFNYVLIAGAAGASVSPAVLGVIRADMTHLAFLGSYGILGTAALLSLACWPWARRVVAAVFAVVAFAVLVNHISMLVRTDADTRSWPEYIADNRNTKLMTPYLKPGGEIVDTGYYGGLRYFYMNDAATPMTFLPPPIKFRYYTDKQWLWIANQIAERRPHVVHINRPIFNRLKHFQPKLRTMYQQKVGSIYILKPEAPIQ